MIKIERCMHVKRFYSCKTTQAEAHLQEKLLLRLVVQGW